RMGMLLLAAIPLLITLPILLIGLPPEQEMGRAQLRAESALSSRRGTGAALLSVPAMLRMPRFWVLTMGLSLVVVGVVGMLTNTVPLLVERGVAPTTAASIFSVIGVSLIVGRMVAGYLIDRLWAP